MLAELIPSEVTAHGHRRLAARVRLWPVVALVIVGLAAGWVVITGMRPAYDAYGWLVWGHQALHLNLNLNAAPSWKPLTFLFTLPYALAGQGAVFLWMLTAVSGAFAAPLFAARVAYRLADPVRSRLGAGIAAAFAALGVLGLASYWHFVLIAVADPLMVALLLAAIDQHLCGRRKLAWILLVLLALGRPEAWVLAGGYAAWAWPREPQMRRALLVGVGVLVVLWFGVSRLSSPSWFVASDVDVRTAPPPPGNGLVTVMNAYFGLYELPMQLAGVVALVLAAVRREAIWLALGSVALAWVLVDIALGLHGMRVAPRYMFEPAAIMVVLAGAAVGRLLTLSPRPARTLAAVALVAFAVVMVPQARERARLAHNGIALGRTWALVIQRLHTAVGRGQVSRVLACGEPLTTVPFQSILAWELGVNVFNVRSVPEQWLRTKRVRLVYFQPFFAGWRIYPFHARGHACARLTINTPFTGGTPLASHLP